MTTLISRLLSQRLFLFSPHLRDGIAGDLNEHLSNVVGLMEDGLPKFAASFIFLSLFLCWFEMTVQAQRKGSVKILPSQLPLQSSDLIIAEMSASSPSLLGKVFGLLLDTGSSDCDFSHCHSCKNICS